MQKQKCYEKVRMYKNISRKHSTV